MALPAPAVRACASSCGGFFFAEKGERAGVKVNDGGDPWSACYTFVHNLRQQWEEECRQCDEKCMNIDWSDPEAEPCNCHEVDGPCDYWRREEGAQRECMDDYCGRYCSGGECASLYRWQCIYPGFSFVSSRKEECLSECSATGGPNPIPPKNCRAVLNPSTATEDACWKLGQGWIELHYADIPNWDWGRGPPPPESCVIKSYEVLDGKPYVPPPPYGPTCLPECEDELDSCIENPVCHNFLEAENKPAFQVCEERYELFRESFESCLEQQRNLCSGVGCMRIYRACRISTGLEVDPIFKDVGCAACDGWWSNRASRELHCAEELSVEQCRWNVLTQSTQSQACARECVWEVCDQAFSECQIAGGTLAECNTQISSMNQCRECNFIHCEDRCNQGACDVIFGSRDEAYRSCAGCDSSTQCNPSSPCYGDSADSSCNWRWAPEFGYSCSILCEESLRMCQEGVRGFCWEPDDTGVSRSDSCHMEYDGYRAAMDACRQENFPANLPEGKIWREVEIETMMTCAAEILPQDWDCLKCDGEWNSWVVWSTDLGPKCIAGTVSFDNGKTVPDTCSNCKPRTCPEYPVHCEARWYEERMCHWNEYNFKICSKSDAEAKAAVVAANAECADCQSSRCEWSCYDQTCAELMVMNPWDRMAPVEQCSGCPDVARCHPGADCFISDVVPFTSDDMNDWEQFLTKFQPMMDAYTTCTGMTLQRRLTVETKMSKVQPPTKPRKSVATKSERTPQVLKDLENKVTALWRQGNRLRNEGRNKRYQLKQLGEQKVGRTNFQSVIARRSLVEKQHQELQKRYLTLVENHGEALQKWQKAGGVATGPPHHPMSSFTQELRTVGSSTSRRLSDFPEQVELACTGTDCATQSGLCDAFFNRGGVSQQLVDSLVTSFSYDLLPWESGDQICQEMAEICYMSMDAAETAILQGVYSNDFKPPWVDEWCLAEDLSTCTSDPTRCSTCTDLTSALDYETCDWCCRCVEDTTGYYAVLKYNSGVNLNYYKCRMLSDYLRRSGQDVWVDYDQKLLGGEGACKTHIDIWKVAQIPDVCHDPECYQSEECAAQCVRPEPTKEMCPSPFTWSFFKSTREWRPGMLATQSSCEVESCYPQPWIPTEEQCKEVSHCESDCPYCETDQFWDWEMKKTMVKCSFVDSKTSKPLSEADCKIACGGAFTGTCYHTKDTRSTAMACITDPPSDALGSTTYEKCVGQKALTGASVTSANYELLQCSSFTTEQCGWAATTFGQDMQCTIHRLQCKNRADCKEAGRCDYEWDDWQIQERGGLCVAPTDFSQDTSYSPHRDFWSECSTLGGEHRSYGCMMHQITTKDACTEAGAKWFPSAHSLSKCEVTGYAWRKMDTGGFYAGTMACCIQLRGSKSEGRCEMFTQDQNSTSCEHCGGTWMSIFKFRSHGRWVEGSWQKNYKWTARAFEPSNKWVTRIAFEKVTDVWQNLIAAIRAVPAVNFVTCRINPTLDTLNAIAKQTNAQSNLGTFSLLPATASASRVGDYILEPFDNSVTGTAEIDVQVNLLSSGAVVAENAAANKTNSSGNRRMRRLSGTGLSDTLTASCYTVVQNNGRYIGQLVGDCIIFNPSTALDNPVSVCLPTSPQIPVYGAFDMDCLVTVNSGVYTVFPVTVTKSSDGLSTCASLSASGTYCPGKMFSTGTPDRTAPSGCGSVTAISDTVTTQAAVLKAAGPVSLPGLVKIGETVSSDGYTPQAVYISSSGTVQSVDDFAETAQQTGTNAPGSGGSSTTVATTTESSTGGEGAEGNTTLEGGDAATFWGNMGSHHQVVFEHLPFRVNGRCSWIAATDHVRGDVGLLLRNTPTVARRR
eukprot:s18_g10.t2